MPLGEIKLLLFYYLLDKKKICTVRCLLYFNVFQLQVQSELASAGPPHAQGNLSLHCLQQALEIPCQLYLPYEEGEHYFHNDFHNGVLSGSLD